MHVARLLQLIAALAALVAVALGMGTYTHADLTRSHMLFGLIIALILLILAVMAVFRRGSTRLGAIGIVYALIVPIFGVTQEQILAGDLHWLIEAAHLVVGFGALTLIGRISASFMRCQKAASAAAALAEAARQAQSVR